jgi:precorrin-6A/cobalt-precorrin-6A reductase
MRPAGEPPHVLILGGTEEGYALALALAGRTDLRVTSSLAGATATPRLPAGAHRVGGFGGVAGLRDWLEAEDVALLVDASHPFALRVSGQAEEAASAAGSAYLRLERPAWREAPGDQWHRVDDLEAGLRELAGLGATHVFAALGARAVPALAASPIRFVVRGIEPPPLLPPNVTWLAGRGPFAVEGERALLNDHRIDALLCRDSGGEGARAKLVAARDLGLPVVLIARPRAVAADAVPDVAAALAAVDRLLSGWPRRASCPTPPSSDAMTEGGKQ